MNADKRIRSFTQSWFITEPVLFSVWNTHSLVKNNNIKTVRIGKRRVEYNEKFIMGLEDQDLKTLMIFEAFRILTKHPYERAKKNPIANQTGSNVTIQEYLATHLEMPRALEMFKSMLKKNRSKEEDKFAKVYEDLSNMDDAELEKMTGMSKAKLKAIRSNIPDYDEEDLAKRHFEFYYNLIDQNLPEVMQTPLFENMKNALEGEGQGQEGEGNDQSKPGDSNAKDHFDPMNSFEQQQEWGEDELVKNEVNDAIQNAQLTNTWGSVPGTMREALIASLKPKIDYRSILRSFRASMIASTTRVNRMRPSRRHGWQMPGKKRDFTTKLAFFVDVSGSMDDRTLNKGFSIINKFFQYGIESTDVYQFDTEIKDEKPLTLHGAKKDIKLLGRGGTNFQCVLDLLAKKGIRYDGVIVYTDGWASRPTMPAGMPKSKFLWLYDTESNYNGAKRTLEGLGKIAFVKSDDSH